MYKQFDALKVIHEVLQQFHMLRVYWFFLAQCIPDIKLQLVWRLMTILTAKNVQPYGMLDFDFVNSEIVFRFTDLIFLDFRKFPSTNHANEIIV